MGETGDQTVLPQWALDRIMRDAPQWHACFRGPAGVVAESDSIAVETREEAEEEAWASVERAVTAAGVEYDRDEWEMLHLLRRFCD